jgi:hypothetical protein
VVTLIIGRPRRWRPPDRWNCIRRVNDGHGEACRFRTGAMPPPRRTTPIRDPARMEGARLGSALEALSQPLSSL